MLNAVIVIDCTDKETTFISSCKAFPETPEGNQQAEALFREWMTEAMGGELGLSEMERNEALDNATNDGLYEYGEGYIALMHTT